MGKMLRIDPINPSLTPAATCGTLPACVPMPATMRIACVRRKSPKIGASTVTDSRTPRRLSSTITRITAPSSGSFQCAAVAGSTLKTWSAPPAIETEIVNT